MLSETSKIEIKRNRDEYPDPRSALLPALYLAQQDYGGWLPPAALDEVATILGLPPAYVASVASFYTMFHRKPVGQHVVEVCTNLSCLLQGSQAVLEAIGRKLGIQPGDTTADGRFTLLEVECLGSCGTAPMMRVGDRTYENLTVDKIDRILSDLERF